MKNKTANFVVSYISKNIDGYVTNYEQLFNSLKEAQLFVKQFHFANLVWDLLYELSNIDPNTIPEFQILFEELFNSDYEKFNTFSLKINSYDSDVQIYFGLKCAKFDEYDLSSLIILRKDDNDLFDYSAKEFKLFRKIASLRKENFRLKKEKKEFEVK